MRTIRIATLLVGALVLGACGGGGGADDAPEAEAPAAAEAPDEPTTSTTTPERVITSGPSDLEPHEPATAWDAITTAIEPDGDVPLDVALQAFALTIGPLPGVELPAEMPPEIGADSGTAALMWVTRHEADLTAEQRVAIATALTPVGAPPPASDPGTVADADAASDAAGAAAGGSSTAAAPTAEGTSGAVPAAKYRPEVARAAFGFDDEHTCTTGGRHTTADQAGTEDYRYYVDSELGLLESKFGEPLGIPVYVTLGNVPDESETLAFASPQSPHCVQELATSCEVRFMTNKMVGANEERIRATVAHELVHCFQARWRPPFSSLTQPPWIAEGFPDFVGNMLHPSAPRTNLAVYVIKYAMPLFERTYDAQGFFFHVDEIGGDPIRHYKDAFVLDDNLARFEELTKHAASFDESWGPIHAFDHLRGNAWYMPDAPAGSRLSLIPSFLENGDRRMLSTEAFPANYLESIEVNAEVVKINVADGTYGRISWDGGGEAMLSAVDGRLYCARPGGCACPEGTQGDPPSAQLPANDMLVAVTGTASVGKAEVIGVSLAEFCTLKPKDDNKIDRCVVGEWVSSEWTLPGPIPDLDGVGGEDARVRIHADGRAEYDFTGMSPITVNDDQIDVTTSMYSDGKATADVEANDGTWKVSGDDLDGMEGWAEDRIVGRYPLEKGPGLFVLLSDGSYTCSGDMLSYTTEDPVEQSTISVLMHKKK